MSEAAVTDGGAPAPAVTPAVVEIEQVKTPEPLGPQTPVAEKPAPAVPAKADQPKTVGEAIKRAQDDVKARDAAKVPNPKPDAPKVDAKPVEKAETKATERGEGGKFVAAEKPAQTEPVKDSPFRALPERFKSDHAAAAEWESAPESVRAATHRVVKELEQGIQKYKPDAEEYEALREFRDYARQTAPDVPVGQSLKQAMHHYAGLEQLVAKDPIQGLERIVSNLGLKTNDGRPITLRDIAGYVLGQKPEEVASKQDATIHELRRELADIKQQVGGVTQTMQQQHVSAIEGEMKSLLADPQFSRFEELAEDIKFFLESGRVDAGLPISERLSEAYKLAERLNPASQPAFTPPAQTRTPQAEAQTLNPAGQKSIAGAPGTGSNPPGRKQPAPSIREALKRAAAQVG